MYHLYSAHITLPCSQTHQHHNRSISPQLLCFLVTYCQVSHQCCWVHNSFVPVRQNVGIVKKDSTPLWHLRDSKDWFILRGKSTVLNTVRKSPSQHNDQVWKRTGISDVDNMPNWKYEGWRRRENLVIREMFVRHRWETGEIQQKAAGTGEWTTEGKGLEGPQKTQWQQEEPMGSSRDWDYLAGTKTSQLGQVGHAWAAKFCGPYRW